MTKWVPLIFAVGLTVSLLGLIPSIVAVRAHGSPTPALLLFGCFTVAFGWGVILWLLGPFPIRPRIVPYFTAELGALLGPTMAAFRRGRALYRNIVTLDDLARRLGVTPLSAFGFAYDHYAQEVRWQPAGDGLQTVEALRLGADGSTSTDPELAEDLGALAFVLRVAVARGVRFALVLRLQARDNLQVVCTRETRHGSFW